jgi:hypothetical protein
VKLQSEGKMAQNLRTQQTQRWTPSTQLSVAQQAEASKTALALRASQADAARLGKQLIGLWPHANPPNPQAYSLGITKTLEKYPLGVAEECCDPAIGLASIREFSPTPASITEWCDRRVKRHHGAIIHGRLEQEAAAHDAKFTPEHRLTMLDRLKGLMRGLLVREREESKA